MTLTKMLMVAIAAISIQSTAQAVDKSDLYVVKFTANWCGPCQQMNRYVWPDQKVQKELRKYRNGKVYSINVDTDKDWVRKYRVTAIPTVIIMDKDGVALKRAVGYMSAEQLANFLDDGVADYSVTRGPPQEQVITYGAATILRWVIVWLARFALFMLT